MKSAKRKRLEAAGWRVGSAKEFLGLSDEDAAFVDLKLALSRALAARRAERRFTQAQVAKMLGSSQSRIAKMEAGDASVSADLLIRGLLALGARPADVGHALSVATRATRVRRAGEGRGRATSVKR